MRCYNVVALSDKTPSIYCVHYMFIPKMIGIFAWTGLRMLVWVSERSCSFYAASSQLRMETNIECCISLKENFNMIRIWSARSSISIFLDSFFVIFTFFLFDVTLLSLEQNRYSVLFAPASQHLFICLLCISSTQKAAQKKRENKIFQHIKLW